MNDHPEPKPPARAEAPQRAPGGPDAIDDPRYGETPGPPTVPDPDPARNPATDETVPSEITEPEERDEPTSDGASEPEKEPPV